MEESDSKSLPEESKRTVSLDTMDKLQSCPGFVEVDPRILAVFADTITMDNDVGYFMKDMSCQTDESNIADLNNMIKIIQNLLEEITVVRRNLLFAKQLLHADYDAKVGGRAMDLYCSVNERLGELEHLYQDRMAITRRSYKTQLADACKKIAGDYKKYYAQMLALETGQSGSVLQELKDTISRQTKVIKIQEQNLTALRSQVEMSEQRLAEGSKSSMSMDSDESIKPDTPPPPPEPDFLTAQIDPDEHKAVVGERDKLQQLVDRLQGELLDSATKQKRLDTRLKVVREEGEEEREKLAGEKKKLAVEIKQLKAEIESLKEENAKVVEAKAAIQKKVVFVDSSASPTPPSSPASMPPPPVVQGGATAAEIEARIKEEVQKVRTEMMIKFKKESEELARQSKDSLRAEQEMRMNAERNLQSQQDLTTRDTGKLAIRHLEKLEEEQRTEISRLNKELDRVTCIYEKKLSVLHNTLINLKNEAFMRNLLHRQAASLHQATLSYSNESPAMNAYLAPKEHTHKRFPERHAPMRSLRPPTVFTEDAEQSDDNINTFITEQNEIEQLRETTLNITNIVK